jgi:serine/threonine-protein kinase
MELVDGNSLTHKIRRISTTGPLDWRYVGRVAAQLSRALAAAHSQHLVHGQITPQNILLRERDLGPLLGDLLLANTLARAKSSLRQLPQDHLDETPYRSPEQTDDMADLDARSDIYSLGAVIYALLTGRPPFLGSSCEETVEEIRHLDPVPPSQYQPTLPAAFDQIVLKMLSKQPQQRFQSAVELTAALAQANSWTSPRS